LIHNELEKIRLLAEYVWIFSNPL
ncbi:MAG: hypothetical protein K940chlam7_02121, partial [Chlamydiae bacterium]|nr:hypothetical protein [Chlamydiota bacterium]